MVMKYPDIGRLVKAGYKVIQRSPWHFQIEGNGTLVNIWPTKRKYMMQFDSGASYYTDVIKAVESIVGTPDGVKPKRPLRDILYERYHVPKTPEQEFAYQQWREGLEILVAQINGV